MLNSHLSRRSLSTAARLGTIAALLAVALPVALVAQNAFSTISGSITDPSDAVLPGVFVVAMDTERRVRHEVRTTAAGRFELVGLPQGVYTLEVDVPGFETFQEKLTLSGQDVNRDITLQVGTLQETIAVTSPSPNVGPAAPQRTLPAAPGKLRRRPRNRPCTRRCPPRRRSDSPAAEALPCLATLSPGRACGHGEDRHGHRSQRLRE